MTFYFLSSFTKTPIATCSAIKGVILYLNSKCCKGNVKPVARKKTSILVHVHTDICVLVLFLANISVY